MARLPVDRLPVQMVACGSSSMLLHASTLGPARRPSLVHLALFHVEPRTISVKMICWDNVDLDRTPAPIKEGGSSANSQLKATNMGLQSRFDELANKLLSEQELVKSTTAELQELTAAHRVAPYM